MAQGSWEVKKTFKCIIYHQNRFCENFKMLNSHVRIFWTFQSLPKMSPLEQYKSEYIRLRISWLWHCFVVCGWRHFSKALKKSGKPDMRLQIFKTLTKLILNISDSFECLLYFSRSLCHRFTTFDQNFHNIHEVKQN